MLGKNEKGRVQEAYNKNLIENSICFKDATI